MIKHRLRLGLTALLLTLVAKAQTTTHIRISTWYWLNSAPKNEWANDFENIKALGFTDVLLVWGLDAAAFSFRVADSQQAIRQAYKAGLHSYLFMWHARHNSLDHQPEFEQVDAAGHHLFAFDAFNPAWRRGAWKTYLQTLARNYAAEPGLAGYVLDNSFAIGRIDSIAGRAPSVDESYISYGHAEQSQQQSRLPRSPLESGWREWTAQREIWWEDWARDTASFIRAVDKNAGHEIFIEDGENAIDPDAQSRTGLDFERVVSSFDAVGAYFAPAYSDPAVDEHLESLVQDYLRRMQAVAGASKVTLSLRLSEGSKEDLPGQAAYPTLNQIRRVVDAALALGVRHIDMYGYRMGVYHLDASGWQQYRPKQTGAYPLTGEIKGKFLHDRPDLWPGLKEYLAQIQSATPRH